MEKPQVAAHSATAEAETEPALVAPRGLDQIISSFRDIYEYIGADGQLDPRWQADFLQQVLSLSATTVVGFVADHDPMTCHRRMTSVFVAAFDSHSGTRAAGKDHQLRRMLCLSSPAHG